MEHGSPSSSDTSNGQQGLRRSRSQKRKSFSDASSFKKARPDETARSTATQSAYGGGGVAGGFQWHSCPASIGLTDTTIPTANTSGASDVHDWFPQLVAPTWNDDIPVSRFTSPADAPLAVVTQDVSSSTWSFSSFTQSQGGEGQSGGTSHTGQTSSVQHSKQSGQAYYQYSPPSCDVSSAGATSVSSYHEHVFPQIETVPFDSSKWEGWQSANLLASQFAVTHAGGDHCSGRQAHEWSEDRLTHSYNVQSIISESGLTIPVDSRISLPSQPSPSLVVLSNSTISTPGVRSKASDTKSLQQSMEPEIETIAHYRGSTVVTSPVAPAPVDKADCDGDLPIHLAATTDKENVVAKIIHLMESVNVSLDTRNNLQQTALHLAAMIGHREIVARLLRHGASCILADRNGNTAVHLAVQSAPIDTLRVILDATGSQEALGRYNYKGFAPLHLAVFRKDPEIVSLLIEKGANCNCLDYTGGRSPLFHAISIAQEEIVRRLIAHGASVNLPSYAGVTPLLVATDRRLKNISSLLISKGATINFRDDLG